MEKELLYKYFSGETTTDEEKQVMDWAEASPDNYRLYLKERKMWNAVLINYPQQTASKRKHLSFNLWKITAIAASLALVFTLSHYLIEKEVPETAIQSIWVPSGQRAQVVLADGSVVWLNSHSKLIYPTSFRADKREVELTGEGYFEIERNEKKPFLVKTKKYNIEVLGTTFNVYAYEKENTFETSLLSGSISVTSNNDTTHKIFLSPNENVYETNGELRKGNVRNLDQFRWKDGLICLDDEPFGDLMERFALYFDITIKIENHSLLEYRSTGKFRQSDGVEYALKVLQKDLRFSYKRNNELNEIIIK